MYVKCLSLGLIQSNDSKLLVKRIIIEKNNTQLEELAVVIRKDHSKG